MTRYLNNKYIAIPFLIMALLAMLILPLPPMVIDALFTFNIVLSVIILLVAISTEKPLNFSIFPTILLVATLMRLALNVASTRVVLLNGHTGPDAAGQVIQSFGQVVIGGNYVVGMAIFLILLIVNFVVITKGGGRVSEVSARFTLDGMPGKQMAIDADLNAGALTQEQSRQRREEVSREADFYGSMDGASKFVRGDAIAGILILAVNLLGGFLIGVFQHDLTASESIRLFSLLTIGDGLVAQIPSLLLATSAAIIVTRVNEESEMSEQLHRQLLASPSILATASAVMAVLGLIPGMPAIAFLTFSVALGIAAWKVYSRSADEDPALDESDQEEMVEFFHSERALEWNDIPAVDRIRLELGYRLVPLADQRVKTPLSSIIRGSRQKLSEGFGFLFPEVSIRDNLDIGATDYLIKIDGVTMESGSVNPDKLVAIERPGCYGKMDGEIVKEPAYGITSVLVDPEEKSKALNLGYSVHDPSTVISIHMSRLLREKSSEVFSHDEVLGIKERLESLSPALKEALEEKVNDMLLLQIFRKLLEEQVSITDIKTIATTLINHSEISSDPIMHVAEIRNSLRRSIIADVNGGRPDLTVYTLSDSLEETLNGIFHQSSKNGRINLENLAIDPELQTRLQSALPNLVQEMRSQGLPPILVVPAQFRPQIAKLARLTTRGLAVLSFTEIPEDFPVNVLGYLG